MTRVGPFLSRVLYPHRVAAGWWFAMAALLVAVDYAVGPYVQFAATFAVPVCLAAWYSGLTPAVMLAIALPFVRLSLMLTVWGEPWDAAAIVTTAVLRASVFTFLAVMLARIAEHERDLERDVELLHDLVPICTGCKRVRDDGDWQPFESFISRRPDAKFTRGLCPRCAQAHAPDYFERAGTIQD